MTVEYGGKQSATAAFFKVTQPTISNWVKEANYLRQINLLETELNIAH